MNRRFILISSNGVDVDFSEQVAKSHGLDLVISEDVENLAELSPSGRDVVILDAMDEQKCKVFETAMESFDPNLIHYMCQSVQEICVAPYLIGSRLPGHWIRRPTEQVSQAAHHYGRVIRASVDKAHGLASLLSLNVPLERMDLNQSIQKESVTSVVRTFLEDRKCNSRSANIITNAVDELLMNAMYNAPVNSDGSKRYGLHIPINEIISLDGRDEISIEVAYEEPYILISVTDLYGSLKRTILLEHIARSFNGFQHFGIQQVGSRAGLGLALIFRAGGSYHFSIDPSRRTTVSIFFDISGSFREVRDKFQFLSTQFG